MALIVDRENLKQRIKELETAIKTLTERLAGEKTADEQRLFERLIADIAARLAQTEPLRLQEAIDETLRDLGRFLRTERAFLARFSVDGKHLRNTNVWTAEGIDISPRFYEVDVASEVPWAAQQLRNGSVIKAGPGLTGLPDEAKDLRLWLEKRGINSGFVVPVRVEGRTIATLGLDTSVRPRNYPTSIIDRLKIVANMIGLTLHRIKAQRRLEQYQHIVESTQNPVGFVDRYYVYQYVNDAYCDAFKKSRPKLIGSSVADLFGKEMFDSILKQQYDHCFAGDNVEFQMWFEYPGWGKRCMDVRYYPYSESGHKVSAVVVSAHDITEVKRIETIMKESEERFRAFMDNNPASIYIKDENDRHIFANPAGIKSVGRKPDDFIGSTTMDLFPPEIADRLIELDRKIIKENVPRITEEWSRSVDGEVNWRKDIKFPIKLESGKKLLGGIALDITKQKLAEQELKKLKDRLEQENIYLREEIEVHHKHDEIIGNTKAVMRMLGLAEQVAETDTTVLVLGETGTGKELLANAIHRLSRRKDRAMIKVNCAALPATLVESELFGREKGAYTGAMSRQIGRFEIADGSTLFLDEIGELPLELQAKLLRVLQEGQFERLGSPKTISVNVRIIASTNRDLLKAVEEGRLREDLYYRLNVFSITAPPLRDRIDDIPLLIWSFVKGFEKSIGKAIHKIHKKSLEALQHYAWPGNIRELKNVVENAMIVSNHKVLKINPPVGSSQRIQIKLKLEDVERDHIKDVLKQTAWKVSGKNGAAELLGLKPTTLESRMKKLGITRPK